MGSILEEFAKGNISPEAQPVGRNSKLHRAMELVADNESKLLDRLNEDDKALLEKYVEAQGAINQITAEKNLIYGFKLGLIMTAEAFVGSGDLIAGEEGC